MLITCNHCAYDAMRLSRAERRTQRRIRMGSEILTRCCNKCNELKPIERFQFKKSKGRYAGTCKDCDNKHRRLIGKNKRDKMAPEQLERKRRLDIARMKRPDAKAKRKINNPKYVAKARINRIEAKFNASIGEYCPILTRNCAQCGYLDTLRFPLKNHHQFTHCAKCLRTHSLKGYTKASRIIQCIECSREVIVFGSAIRCAICSASNSKVIRSANKKKYIKTQSSHSKRARLKGCVYEAVNRRKVYERDKYRCYLCGIKVVLSKTYRPDQASIDHIIPISKGGAHTYSNIKTCCIMCNSIKSDSVVNGTQITLSL